MSLLLGRIAASNSRWSPRRLSSPPSIWLNDQSRLVYSGNAVSLWGDLSPQGYDAIQDTSTAQPVVVDGGLNGRRIVRFDDQQYLDLSASSYGLYRAAGSAWMFCLYRLATTDSSANTRAAITFCTADSAHRIARVALEGSSGTIANTADCGGRRLDSDDYISLNANQARSEVWVMALSELDYLGNTITLRINGSLEGQMTGAWPSAGYSDNTDSVYAVIGSNARNETFLRGEIAEIMCGVALPNAAEVDKIFGYAAWRWGLVSRLPAGHPYKDAPPK